MLMLNYKPQCLFIYGTLQDDQVQRALLGRVAKRESASVSDYVRGTIHLNTTYPIALPQTGATIFGSVITVTEKELEILDYYEGDAYTRQRVRLSDGSSAWIYVSNPHAPFQDKITVPANESHTPVS